MVLCYELHTASRKTADSFTPRLASRHELDGMYQQLKETPRVASVSIKDVMIQQFRDTIAENQAIMQSFTVFFAAVIAIGVAM